MTALIGELRENNGTIEAWTGRSWVYLADLGNLSFKSAAAGICAPLDATPAEISRWMALADKADKAGKYP